MEITKRQINLRLLSNKQSKAHLFNYDAPVRNKRGGNAYLC